MKAKEMTMGQFKTFLRENDNDLDNLSTWSTSLKQIVKQLLGKDHL
jgi:hypothetical protein